MHPHRCALAVPRCTFTYPHSPNCSPTITCIHSFYLSNTQCSHTLNLTHPCAPDLRAPIPTMDTLMAAHGPLHAPRSPSPKHVPFTCNVLRLSSQLHRSTTVQQTPPQTASPKRVLSASLTLTSATSQTTPLPCSLCFLREM